MKSKIKEKKKSGTILAASAGIFVIALSISSFFLIQIISRMNQSANQTLLSSSRIISEGLNSKMTLDRELVFTLADLLASEQENTVENTLQKYADSTDFFRFSYVSMDGKGIDSQGDTVDVSDMPFEETALSREQTVCQRPIMGPADIFKLPTSLL